MEIQPNNVFANRYQLIRRIGTGGYSQIWLAEDNFAGKMQLALKIFAPEKGLDDIGLSVFSKEYSVVFNLNHPGLLLPRHFDQWNNSPYLTLTYCEKGSAYRLIGEMGEKELANFLQQAATALQYLHNQEPPIIHQDIKPDNFLIDNRGNYLLSDFGISSKIRRTLTRSMGHNPSAGTLAYMPPEKFTADKQIIKAGDVFALGVTLYELLTGDLPFGEHGGLVLKNGADIPNLPGNFSPDLNKLLQSCMAKEPWDRPTTEKLIKISSNYLSTGQWENGSNKMTSPKVEINPSRETQIIDPSITNKNFPKNRDTRKETISGAEFEFVFVEGGTFMMGLHDSESNKKLENKVTLSGYWIGKYPVTQYQYEAITGENPSFFKKETVIEKGFLGIGREVKKETLPDHPVEMVSWFDCNDFYQKISKLTGKTFRLPTEAEWEFAARGGNISKGFIYSGSNIIDEVAWYDENSESTKKVGQKKPNELGIYDMSGNVWEWCNDWYDSLSAGSQTNPKGPDSGSEKTARGGSWFRDKIRCKATNRGCNEPNSGLSHLGFRIAISS